MPGTAEAGPRARREGQTKCRLHGRCDASLVVSVATLIEKSGRGNATPSGSPGGRVEGLWNGRHRVSAGKKPGAMPPRLGATHCHPFRWYQAASDVVCLEAAAFVVSGLVVAAFVVVATFVVAAAGFDPSSLNRAVAEGFEIKEKLNLANLGIEIAVFGLPAGIDAPSARARLSTLSPGAAATPTIKDVRPASHGHESGGTWGVSGL